jgi:uncharacterized protein (DUF302 family)
MYERILIFGNPGAGARVLAHDLAAAVDIPLRLAVIGRDDGSEIVLRARRRSMHARALAERTGR